MRAGLSLLAARRSSPRLLKLRNPQQGWRSRHGQFVGRTSVRPLRARVEQNGAAKSRLSYHVRTIVISTAGRNLSAAETDFSLCFEMTIFKVLTNLYKCREAHHADSTASRLSDTVNLDVRC